MSPYSDTKQRKSKRYQQKHAQLCRDVIEAREILIAKGVLLPDDKQERKRAASIDFRLRCG